MTADTDYEPSPIGWVRDQVERIESSGGTEGTTLRGTDMPVVVVTNRGQRSGKIRKTPLMRVEHGGRYLAVGSQGGAPTDPQWVHNLRADPQVEVRDGTTTTAMRARELPPGPERDEWWGRAVETFPPYADYQTKTERLIPVFVLEP